MVHRKGGYRSEVTPPSQQDVRQSRAGRARDQRFADKAAFHGINWEHYRHYQLYDMIMSATPGEMGRQAAAWSTLATAIKQTTDGVDQTIKSLLSSWRGSAAVSAGTSATALAQWAEEASDRSARIGEGLVKYTEAVETAQHRMPPPEFASAKENFAHGYDVKASGGPSTALLLKALLSDQQPNFEKQQQSYHEAVQVMKDYAAQSQQVHDTMPWLPAERPTTPNTDSTGPQLGGSGSDGGGPGSDPPTKPPGTPGVPGTPGGQGGPSDGTTPEGVTATGPGFGGVDTSTGGPGSGYG